MVPFFSICISSYNRSETIVKTLQSLLKQSIRDFEVIIVDCLSQDNTLEIINLFFNSDEFLLNPFIYKIIEKKWEPKTVEDWNEPLHYSNGKYTLSLEGDDQILENLLSEAKNFLEMNPNVGLYFPGSKYKNRLFDSVSMFNYLYTLDAIPAPSEAIFKSSHKENKFLYNILDFIYCPEVELYMDIVNCGYLAYYSGTDGVIRDKTIKSRGKFKYYRDHFYILDKYYNVNTFTRESFKESFNVISHRAYLGLVYDHLFYKGKVSKELNDELRNKFGFGSHHLKIGKAFFFIIFRAIKRKFKKIG